MRILIASAYFAWRYRDIILPIIEKIAEEVGLEGAAAVARKILVSTTMTLPPEADTVFEQAPEELVDGILLAEASRQAQRELAYKGEFVDNTTARTVVQNLYRYRKIRKG